MKHTLSTYEAAHLLLKDENAKWTREAAFALVEYYEQLEEDVGEIEFDVVAIRCDWTEYKTARDIASDYSHNIKVTDDMDDDDVEKVVTKYIERNSHMIKLSNGNFLVRIF
jgi:hypothetical protein